VGVTFNCESSDPSLVDGPTVYGPGYNSRCVAHTLRRLPLIFPLRKRTAMILDRRQLLLNATAAVATLPTFSSSVASLGIVALEHTSDTLSIKWHPMVEEILGRARKTNRQATSDRGLIEHTIKRRAEATAYQIAPVEWLETPADAHAYLSHQGLEVLLKADVTRFWKLDDSAVPRKDFGFPESAYDAQREAEHVFRVDERETDVGAPKRAAKDRAIARNIPAQDVFHTRAVSSQIGWLETVIPRAAACSINRMELLLSMGMPEGAVEITSLRDVFDAHEHGLLATWETTSALVCVARERSAF
jgi:hypothetical protein